MATDSALDLLAASKYLRLTTFKRDGTAVPTPVWLVRDGSSLLVTTTDVSGKAKRIRHTPRVLLTPCDSRGKVSAGAVEVEATAEVVDGPAEVARLETLLRARYGVMFRAMKLINRMRRETGQRIEIRLTLAS